MYTRFRAWKRTNQPSPVAAAVADTPANQAQSRATAAAPTATTASTALHFVNTAHPEEATSSEVIGHIRSHVARKIHARRREVKKKQGTRPPPSGPEARGNHADKSHGRPKTGRAFPARRYSHVAAGTVCQIPPTRRSQLPAASLCVTPPPNLGAYLSRPLSDDECFLLDYYVKSMVPKTFGTDWEVRRVFSTWLPLTLSDSGLLSALLLVICRCLVLYEACFSEDGPYGRMAVVYKGISIRSIRTALSKEGTSVSDITIAMVMVMCSYETKFGDDSIARCHANAIAKMLELRGGTEHLQPNDGIGRFLVEYWKQIEDLIRARSLFHK